MLLHPAIRTRCRHIDRIILKGVADPMDVYTFDICVKDMKHKDVKTFIATSKSETDEEEEKSFFSLVWQFFSKNSKKTDKTSAVGDEIVNPKLFAALAALQSGISTNFIPTFNRAVNHYLNGEWTQAKEAFSMAGSMRPEDDSGLVLMSIMEAHNFVAPKDWKGYRELKSK
jgi:hypothetical protein